MNERKRVVRRRKSNSKKNRFRPISSILLSFLVIAAFTVAGVMLYKNVISEDGKILADSDEYVKEYTFVSKESYAGGALDATAVTKYKFTFSSYPAGAGKISMLQPFSASEESLSLYADKNTFIDVQAVANKGYSFVGWYRAGNISGKPVTNNDQYHVNAKASDNLVAVFTGQSVDYSVETMTYKNTSKAFDSSENINYSDWKVSEEGGSVASHIKIEGIDALKLYLDAIPNENYKFCGFYYLKSNGVFKQLSTKTSYSLVISNSEWQSEMDSKIYAFFADSFKGDNGGKIRINFANSPGSGAVTIQRGDVTSTDSDLFKDAVASCTTSSASLLIERNFSDYITLISGIPAKNSDNYFVDVKRIDDNSYATVISVLSLSSKNDEINYVAGHFKLVNKYHNWKNERELDLVAEYKSIMGNTNVNEVSYRAVTFAIPEEGGTTSGDATFTRATSTSISAIPNKGYKFLYWKWQETDDTGLKDHISYDSQLYVTPGRVTMYKAYFAKKLCEVSIASNDPAEGGKVIGLGKYAYDSDAEIQVIANEGYEFDKATYTTSDGVAYTETNPKFTIKKIKEDTYLHITYKQNNYRVYGTVDILGDEKNSYNYVTMDFNGNRTSTDKNNSYTIASVGKNSTVTLEAFPNTAAEYRFVQWAASDGSVSTSNPLVVANPVRDVTYTAQFERVKHKINVSSDPEVGGSVIIYDEAKPDITRSDYMEFTVMTDDTGVLSGRTAILEPSTAEGYDFDYWTDSHGTKITGDKSANGKLKLNDIRWDESYTAHFRRKQITITLDQAMTSEVDESIISQKDSGVQFGTIEMKYIKDGTETTTGALSERWAINNVDTNKSIILSATPKSGYSFLKWQDDKGNVYSDNPVRITNISEDVVYTAIYSKSKYTISVVASPVDGGSVTVNDTANGAILAEGAKATLKARANDGYRIEYWTNEAGTKLFGQDSSGINVLELEKVEGNDTYTAHFIPLQYEVTVDLAMTSGVDDSIISQSESGKQFGKVDIDYTNNNSEKSVDSITTKKSFSDVDTRKSFIITAKEESGYTFLKWMDSKGTLYSDNPLIITNQAENITYTAIFSETSYTINVRSAPVDGGTVYINGKSDSAVFGRGETAVISAYAAEGYKLEYFTNEAGNKFFGDIDSDGVGTLTLGNVEGNDTYTAHFVTASLAVTINLTPEEAGYVSFNDNDRVNTRTSYEIESGSNASLTAYTSDKDDYKFERWEDSDGKVYTNNPLELVHIVESKTYMAVFVSKKIGAKVVASPASGGIATKMLSDDNKIILKAQAAKGYRFKEWRVGDEVISTSSKCEADDYGTGVTYTAYFEIDKDYDAKSDIVKYHFYNDKRRVTDPNYTVTRASITVMAGTYVSASRAEHSNDLPDSMSDGAVAELKNIYDEKLEEIKVDRSALLLDDELVTTDSEILSLTTRDEKKDQMERLAGEFVSDKFGDRYSAEIITIKSVILPESFEPDTKTYLWKKTGVDRKETIYILYSYDDESYDWVAATIDEGKTIKFTLDEMSDGTIMAIIRVNVE